MASKEKEKEKKKKKSSSSSKGKTADKGKENGEVQPQQDQDQLQLQQPDGVSAMDPFEHGRAFQRYCDPKTNKLSREQFSRMMHELRVPLPIDGNGALVANKLPEEKLFDAGMLFEKFDTSRSGFVAKHEFQKIYHELFFGSSRQRQQPQYDYEHYYRPGMRSGEHHHQTEQEHIYGSPLSSSPPSVSTSSDRLAQRPYDQSHLESNHHSQEPKSVSYSSPLPHLSVLPGSCVDLDDSSTAMLRRDFMHLQSLLEATLAPRIESEVVILEKVAEAKRCIRKEADRIETETRAQIKAVLKRLDCAVESRCKRADEVAIAHRKMLEKINQFQYLAAGPRPRDALRIESLLPVTQLLSSLKLSDDQVNIKDSKVDPALAMYRRQREHAQRAFLDQERFPHPVVMRDFVNLFKDFQGAAQKLVDMPYSQLQLGLVARGSGVAAGDVDLSSLDNLERIVHGCKGEDRLRNEVMENKSAAEEAASLREDLKLKDQMIFTLVEERESFEEQKKDFMRQVEELASASATEIKSWADMYTQNTQQLEQKIAQLQEQNRVLSQQ